MFLKLDGPIRRFSAGRVVGNIDAADTNLWLTSSELCLCGRPLNDNPVLPLSKDLILPESLSAEDDLRQAERQRPSVEATSAQKGVERWCALLQSMLTVSGNGLKDKSVVILNLTPYVEDVGCAVSWIECLSLGQVWQLACEVVLLLEEPLIVYLCSSSDSLRQWLWMSSRTNSRNSSILVLLFD